MDRSRPKQPILRGWKEIAAYADRDVRTVQRWESRGLPIRRVPGSEKGNVFALTSEVEAWLHPPIVESLKIAPGSESPAPTIPLESSEARHFGGWLGLLSLCGVIVLTIVTTVAVRHPKGAWLGIKDGTDSIVRVPGRGYADPEYLQATKLFGKRTPDSLVSAEQLFRRALQRDPDIAPAWSGLAQTLTIIGSYGLRSEVPTWTEAREAAQKALLLDPSLSEPHAVLGFLNFFWLGDTNAAEVEFRNALRSPSAGALAYSWYGTMLTYQARYAEALVMLDAAQKREPGSVQIRAARAFALGLSGRRDEGVQLLRGLEHEGDPLPSVRYDLAILSLLIPRDPRTFLDEEIWLNRIGHNKASLRDFSEARQAYLCCGEKAMWRSLIQAPPSTEFLLDAYAALGDRDAALELVSTLKASDPRLLSGIAMDPVVAPLQSDSRFKRILKPAGSPSGPLPQENASQQATMVMRTDGSDSGYTRPYD